jgi:DNA topoisomerase-6 subunit B
LRRERIEEISAADFFYRNRAIAGFDNPVRATYTIVRELVENSLDAAEEAGVPPKIMITMDRVERRENGSDLMRISIRDNGIGLSADEIPRAFGKVFTSSKYRLIQSRGTFGLGGTMALLYGQITTNRPFTISSAKKGDYINRITMMIDVQKNEPIVIKREVLEIAERSFTAVESYFEGSYARAKRKIIDYLYQTAIVVPYADIMFVDPDGVVFLFPRSTDEMPPRPKESLFHPKGVDLELLQRLIRASRASTVKGFLKTSFQRIGDKTADEVLAIAGIPADKKLRDLRKEEIEALYNALRSYDKFMAPDHTVLSPLGKKLLEEGIKKELRPDFVYAVQRPPSVYEGHPFIVETAIAYGGDIKPAGEIQLYRFANRIPLLYDTTADVSYQVAKGINWSNYGIRSLEEEPIALFFHIVSTKIPFKTVGKEYIAAVPEVEREVELGFRTCARELKLYLYRIRRKESLAKRAFLFRRFYEIVAECVEDITGERPSVETLLKMRFGDLYEGAGEGEDNSGGEEG